MRKMKGCLNFAKTTIPLQKILTSVQDGGSVAHREAAHCTWTFNAVLQTCKQQAFFPSMLPNASKPGFSSKSIAIYFRPFNYLKGS